MTPDDLRWRDLSQHEGPATPPEAYAEPTPCCARCGLPDGDHMGGCPESGTAPQPGAPG